LLLQTKAIEAPRCPSGQVGPSLVHTLDGGDLAGAGIAIAVVVLGPRDPDRQQKVDNAVVDRRGGALELMQRLLVSKSVVSVPAAPAVSSAN
jgi:hypothetical protein